MEKDISLVLDPRVEFHKFDERGCADRWVCELRHQDDAAFRCIVPHHVMACLQFCKVPRRLSDVLTHANVTGESPVLLVGLEKLMREYFVRKGILMVPGVTTEAPEPRQRADEGSSYLTLRYRLLSGSVVGRIGSYLSWLFRWPVVVSAMALMIGSRAYFYFTLVGLDTFVQDLSEMTPMEFLTVVVVSVVAAICHEFGHSTALVRHGGRDPEVGFGIYHVFPVLYTDVSDCWRLSRSQRAQVDVGGIYFQAICCTVAGLCGFMMNIPGYEAAVVWCDLLMVRSLNPFFRLDGYWLLTDVSGSAGIWQESKAAAQAIWNNTVQASTVSGWIRGLDRLGVMLAVYCVLTVVVFVLLYSRVIWFLFSGVLPGLSERVGNTLKAIADDSLAAASWELALIVVHVAFIGLVLTTGGRFVLLVLRGVQRRRTSMKGTVR